MWRIRWHVDCLARAYYLVRPPKNKVEFAIKQRESFLEIVTVRRGSTARRHVPVDQAKAACCIVAAQRNSVGISHHPNVGDIPGFFGFGIRIMEPRLRRACAKTRVVGSIFFLKI
jgi:hypothetical protein